MTTAVAGGPPDRASAGGWALAAALAGYVLFATLDWDVPQPGAVSFGPLWAAATGLAVAGWTALGRRVTPVAAIAIGAVAAMALTDAAYLPTQGLRDLHLYLGAGERFAAGDTVYLDRLFTERPDDLSTLPFLYPPPTLPLFAALAALPRVLVEAVWLTASVAAALAALRLFGVSWPWAVLLLLWPPIFQGIQVGNVAVLLALLFAAGPWVGAGLVVAAVFKLYSGIAAGWLVRERRVSSLAAGVAAVGAWCLASLPITGPDTWAEWWRGLELYRDSQPLLPGSLYGFGLPRYLPGVAALAVAGVVVGLAFRARGASGLARFGLAAAVASPSLFAHGLIVALPAFLELRPIALWTALAITSVAPGAGWWLAIGLVAAAWLIPGLRGGGTIGETHPLGRQGRPWTSAPVARDG
jgi:hypothetical protein